MAENEDEGEDEEPAPEPFRGDEALALARQGKDAWNAWADKKENAGREVDFRDVDFTTEKNKGISFDNFIFPGDVYFSWARLGQANFNRVIFKGKANFSGVIVEEIAWFQNTIFNEEAVFIETLFKGEAFFRGTVFEEAAFFTFVSFNGFTAFTDTIFQKDVIFTGATFSGLLHLNSSRFQIIPDFRGTDFQKHISLHGIEVDFRRPVGPEDADKYRRLRDLAVAARDHDREQMFFGYELKAKHGYETRGLLLVLDYIFEWLTDFRRDLNRPLAWLLIIWNGFGVLYVWIASKDMSHLWDGLLFSAAQLFPFLGASREAHNDAKAALFGEGPLSIAVNFLTLAEGFFGIVLLFLIVMMLRKRFRL